MGLFKTMFTRGKILKECPRCRGKGDVDIEDITRLKMELIWLPGKCAFCDGSGKVDPNMEDKVPVDTAYLVDGLSEDERHRIIIGEPDALERGKFRVEQIQHFINQVSYLHFEARLDADRITRFFLISENPAEPNESQKQELLDYVQLIIDHQSSQH